MLPSFRQGLRELGWVDGQNIRLEQRYAEWKMERLPSLAAELVRLRAGTSQFPPANMHRFHRAFGDHVMAVGGTAFEPRAILSQLWHQKSRHRRRA